MQDKVKYNIAATVVTSTSSGASADVLYTCPPFYMGKVVTIHVCVGSGANKKLSIQRFNSTSNTYSYLLEETEHAANTYSSVLTDSTIFILNAGDKLVASMQSGGVFTITTCAEETIYV
jgi:hypothetical protein